ncbi:hypothetical protein [Bacteroides reticulotermitis]|uniref:hypothetical protein n=1 Tax=Bacteroides reticulotermitis TaxID=1133319 RepID=UPI003A84831E
MCKWCEKQEVTKYEVIGTSKRGNYKWGNNKSLRSIPFCSDPDMKIEGNNLIIDYNAYSCDSSFHESIEINYCPFCGRKLDTDAVGIANY